MAKKGDTNASPSAYGWVFQVGAGITLMLDNVKDFTSMKMEGKSDDIEFTLNGMPLKKCGYMRGLYS